MYLGPKLAFKGTRAQRSLHDFGSADPAARFRGTSHKAMAMNHDRGGKLGEKI